jgi:predicted ferric reductase
MKARLVLSVIGILLLLITVVFFTAASPVRMDFPIYLRTFGLLFAAVGIFMIFLQFVFVSRIKIIEIGIGLDRMLRWHRIMGRTGLALVTLHAVMIAFYRITVFGELFPNTFIWVGFIALISFMITAALASLYKKIAIAYETWRNIHLINYLLFPFVLIHVFYHTLPGSLLYYLYLVLAVLFAAVIVYRLISIRYIKNNPYEVVKVSQEAEDIWSLYLKGKKIHYWPGQFMFIQLLRDGRLSSPHPFTISNSPTREHLSITPKDLGDFTSTIKETRVGDKAYIDAPYGVFSFLNYDQEELVFIAGGIGITPFMSMLRYIYDLKLDLKVTLFWVNGSEMNLCFQEELRQIQEALPNVRVVLVMTRQDDWEGEKGRLDADTIEKHLDTLDRKDFFVCGPVEMNRAVIALLKKMNVPSSRIHSELFSL